MVLQSRDMALFLSNSTNDALTFVYSAHYTNKT